MVSEALFLERVALLWSLVLEIKASLVARGLVCGFPSGGGRLAGCVCGREAGSSERFVFA